MSSTAGTNYVYDANGNRVKKSSGSTGTLYWYASPGIIAETDLNGTVKSEYVFFGGKRVARIDSPGNSVHYYLSDHLSSTTMVVSSAGAPEEESDYSPFGTEYPVTSTGTNHYKFTSKERDNETGLDYFGARYYSSALGRFISVDPDLSFRRTMAIPQRWNRYAYVIDQPLNRLDPDGAQDVVVYFMRDTTTDNSTTGRMYMYGNNGTSLEGRYLEPGKKGRIPSGDYNGSFLPKKNSSAVKALFAFPTKIQQGKKIRTNIESHNGNFARRYSGLLPIR